MTNCDRCAGVFTQCHLRPCVFGRAVGGWDSVLKDPEKARALVLDMRTGFARMHTAEVHQINDKESK